MMAAEDATARKRSGKRTVARCLTLESDVMTASTEGERLNRFADYKQMQIIVGSISQVTGQRGFFY